MSIEILNNPFKNKGTAFSSIERTNLGLKGLLPPAVQTLTQQAHQVYDQFKAKKTDLEKRLFLMGIFNTNRVLFFKVFSQHITEFMPIVYDPTIAQSIEEYSKLFIKPQGSAYLSIDAQKDIKSALKNAAAGRDIRLIVVTDGQGILGIGDWGINGIEIAVGKLMVYTAAAGINPKQVLPVVLDVGTNNQKLLKDPLYLGNRHQRVTGDRYYTFIRLFVDQVEKLFPNVYLHFEDFGREHAAKILNQYKNRLAVFNDDIQGTGIVVLGGILGALKISHEELLDQTYVSFGAGTAGTGIVQRIYSEFIQEGMSKNEARKHFYLVDKQGLLFDDDKTLTPEQKLFARKRTEFKSPEQLTNLKAVVKAVHPSILVGTSTVHNAFSKEIVQEMAAHTPRPIIFPVSNPTNLAEAKAKDLIQWTDGKALVACGVPSAPFNYKGVSYTFGQANNALVYPGLALGALSVGAKRISDRMIDIGAHSLGGIVDTKQPGAAVLPPIDQINRFSIRIAQAVGKSAVFQKLNRKQVNNIPETIKNFYWKPKY